MADIVYTVDYDETNGLRTSQRIVKLGSRDRIRFVTTKQSDPKYKIALKRDKTKSWPFKKGLADPYVLPLDTAKAKWIDVVHSGGKFRYICGYMENKKGKEEFEEWPKPTHGIQQGGSQAHSLPFPT